MTTFVNPLRWPEGWPRTPRDRRAWGNFGRQLTLYRAHTSLAEEMKRAGAKNLVVTANLTLNRLGLPNADQRQPDDVGIACYFTIEKRELVMAQDAFDRVEKNMRSLALAIEHMRGLERHGGAHMMERAFAGFSALPPPSGGSAAEERPVIWRDELAPIPDGLSPADTLLLAEARFREKAKRAHSDVGGDDTAMIRLNAAIAAARAELKG